MLKALVPLAYALGDIANVTGNSDVAWVGLENETTVTVSRLYLRAV
jgi:hypothetical protein